MTCFLDKIDRSDDDSESCPSGLRCGSRKAVCPKGTVGSNPMLSALTHRDLFPDAFFIIPENRAAYRKSCTTALLLLSFNSNIAILFYSRLYFLFRDRKL